MDSEQKPDQRDQDFGPKVVQGPVLGYNPPQALSFGVIGATITTIINGIRRNVPINLQNLASLDVNNITKDDQVEITGNVDIGRGTDNLVSLHRIHTSPDNVDRMNKATLKVSPHVQNVGIKPPGKPREKNPIIKMAKAPWERSIAAQAAMSRLRNVLDGVYANPGEIFQAPVLGPVDAGIHVVGADSDDKSAAKATMKAGGSSIGMGMGTTNVKAASMKTSCMPNNISYGHLAPNPLLNNLGPSTTMNPFPPYLVDAGKFLIGIYAMSRAMSGLKEALDG